MSPGLSPVLDWLWLTSNPSRSAIFETDQAISMERFADYPSLGRFSLRDSGATIAIGKVTKILDADAPDVSGLSISGSGANGNE